jgi:DNA-binding Lrp family transcriptional regulator
MEMRDLNDTERKILLLLQEGHNDSELIAEVLDLEPEEVDVYTDKIIRLGYINAYTVH